MLAIKKYNKPINISKYFKNKKKLIPPRIMN